MKSMKSTSSIFEQAESASDSSMKRGESSLSLTSNASGDDEVPEPGQGRSCYSLLKVIHCSVGFLLLHVAYGPVANLVTISKGSLGFVALSLISFCFGMSALLAPSLQVRLGLRLSLFIGATGYVIFIITCIPDAAWPSLLGAVAIGIGAGLLWNGQAVYTARNATAQTMGLYNGIFFSLFQFNSIIGNFSAGLLKATGLGFQMLFIGASVVGGASLIILAFLRPPMYTPVHTHHITVRTALKNAIKASRDMKWFVLLIMGMGLKGAFLVGKAPLVVKMGTGSESTALYCFVAYGIANVIASLINGKMFDRFGWKALAINIVLFWSIGVACLFCAAAMQIDMLYYVFFVCFGIVDSSDNLLVCALVSKLWKNDVGTYLSVYRFVAPVMSGIGYLYSPMVDTAWFYIEASATTLVLFVGLFVFVIGTRYLPESQEVDFVPLKRHESTVDLNKEEDEEAQHEVEIKAVGPSMTMASADALANASVSAPMSPSMSMQQKTA